MSGMHMLPVFYTTTNQKKRKAKKTSAKLKIAQAEHQKYLKKMGYVPKEERCYGSTTDFSPVRQGSIPCSSAIPTSDKVGNGFVRETHKYHGNVVIGQAYNKGGLVVLSAAEQKDENTGKRR